MTVGQREVEQARELNAFLADRKPNEAVVTVGVGADQHLELPPELTEIVLTLVELVGRGSTVTVGSIPTAITTTVAANMLRMSRPSLMKLVRAEQIPSHKVGSHTRLFTRDVLAFRRQQLEHQSEAFDELRALEEEWGVVD
ncbi:helix-turn-helix domain-containing protein [Nocardia sp. NPDC057353]|uniref:helix-turn-helix domain-containing protein n=1 Tax=Nocardia sp. NPDC057353 TaxID=3346104 RepID=UPI003632056F